MTFILRINKYTLHRMLCQHCVNFTNCTVYHANRTVGEQVTSYPAYNNTIRTHISYVYIAYYALRYKQTYTPMKLTYVGVNLLN